MKKMLLVFLSIIGMGLYLFSVKAYAYNNRVIAAVSSQVGYQYVYNYNVPSASSKYFIEIFPDGAYSSVIFIPCGKISNYIRNSYYAYPYYEKPSYYIPVGPPPYNVPAGPAVKINYNNN